MLCAAAQEGKAVEQQDDIRMARWRVPDHSRELLRLFDR